MNYDDFIHRVEIDYGPFAVHMIVPADPNEIQIWIVPELDHKPVLMRSMLAFLDRWCGSAEAIAWAQDLRAQAVANMAPEDERAELMDALR